MCEYVKNYRKILLYEPHGARGGQKFVADGGGGHGHVELAAEFESQQHIFLHHVDVEPRFVGQLQHERTAVFDHRGSDGAVGEYVHGNFAFNAAFFGEQHAFAEGQHLNSETEVRGDFDDQREAIVAHVRDLWSNILQHGLDALEGVGTSANHHRQFAFL